MLNGMDTHKTQEKTLIILIGNARGGEQAWNSLYNNLLDVYSADLCLCFGKNTINNNNILYDKAKYIFNIEEFMDWSIFYQNILPRANSEYLFKSFLLGKYTGLAGGISKCIGSGAIIFAFRYIIKNFFNDVCHNYDRIILTRSDHFYLMKQPYLSNDRIWVVEGEDYNGITDRHHIFPIKFFDQMLGIIEYMNSEIGFLNIRRLSSPNPEMVLLSFFKHLNTIKSINRFPRTMFTVATPQDSTRWQKPTHKLPGIENLYIKYITEYNLSLKNYLKTQCI